MSQIFARPKNYILYSELHFSKPRSDLESSFTEVVCQICRSKLKEGISITAKRIGKNTIMICSQHGF